METIEKFLDHLFGHRVILNCEKSPYLKRWYVIRTEPFAFFIHKFIRSDEDRALHDHPWNFVIVPIWRGYIEHQDRGKRRVYPLMISARSAEYRHRVELVDGLPSWSLFFRFARRRGWGFWPSGGFVEWRKWWNDLCED